MKKLLAVLGMITCMAGLAACGQEDKPADGLITQEEAVTMGGNIVSDMNTIVKNGEMEQYANQPILYNGLVSWQSALKDIGAFEGTNGGSAEFGEEETTIKVNVLGSDHDAVVEIVMTSDLMYCEAVTTNVQYSTGEIMAKAGMNTVIGMGTVFAVLILISLIISCFTLVSKIEGGQKKKEQEKESASAAAAADPVVAQIAAKEELSDDTELVAVIAAAVAAYEGAASTDGFVVRSIRKSNKTKWQSA